MAQARALRPARLLTHWPRCTRDYPYIAPRYGGCGRVGTALVTLKGRTIYGMREHACVCNDYPCASATVIAFIIPLRASVREATSVRRGRTARTIEARTTAGGIRLHNYVSASRPLIRELSERAGGYLGR